jgi:hypothetical protein
MHITYPSALAVVNFQPFLCFTDTTGPGVVDGGSLWQHVGGTDGRPLLRAGGSGVGARGRLCGGSRTTARFGRLGYFTTMVQRR